MSTETAPDSCPFCGAGILIGADGRECRSQNQWVTFQCFTNWHPNYREPRRSQSFECIAAERERLTRERDEARSTSANLGEVLGKLVSRSRTSLASAGIHEGELGDRIEWVCARVHRLEEAGNKMETVCRNYGAYLIADNWREAKEDKP